MSQASAQAFPQASYPTGSYTLPSTVIPDWVASLELQIARCTDATPANWPSASTIVSMDVQYSLDGGTTWIDGEQFSSSGGIFNDGSGEAAYSTASLNLPAGTSRHVKGTMTITDGPLVTNGTLFMSDTQFAPA